jgi:anaerobic selenocysteine-containing dehydrogenase
MHPQTAAQVGVSDGAWVAVESPQAAIRAVARLTEDVPREAVYAQAGWWEGCEELGLPAYDPLSPEGSNVNRLLEHDQRDPLSGAVPLKSSICRVRPLSASD